MWPLSHTRNLVIGSGFGGAVLALRLAQAGESVTVLERGLTWPNAPWRPIFASELLADGRALWFKDRLKTSGMSMGLNLKSSFAGVMIQPERRYFDAIFQGQVSFDQMNAVY